MHKLRILLAEDMAHERLVIETNLRDTLPENVEPTFTSVDHAEAAVEQVRRNSFDLVILDIDFSKSTQSKGMTGLTASQQIKRLKPDLYCVVVSSSEEEATMNQAVEEYGVDWYLRRSSISYDELAWLARQALLSRLHAEGLLVEERYRFLTRNTTARHILRRADAILPGQNTLIYGETGTGKELIARRIHANAKAFDAKRPLKVLDCSALSPTLFEGEVFGHKKGSFTGAVSDRAGALQLVNGGDLFLDEIHNIPIHLQQKLLRVLNDGVFSPLGSNEEIRSKFRIIAATNIPIDEAIRSGKLLPDFVERVRKIKIDLLPLRDRPEDLELLIKGYVSSIGLMDKEFSADAIDFMKTLPWSGNIRELRGFIDTAISAVKIPIIGRQALEALLTVGKSKIKATDLPPLATDLVEVWTERLLKEETPGAKLLDRLESNYIAKMHGRYDSLRSMADATGYDRRTLAKRLRKLGLNSKA